MNTQGKVAVIGMACRLPGGVDSPDSLWSMLAEGRDGWGEIPRERWDWRSFYHEDPEAKQALHWRHGYFVDQDLSAFDARVFGIAGPEAMLIDPKQRLLLETTYEAVENAGIPIESLRGSNTSVHMALGARDYERIGYKDISGLHQGIVVGSGDAISGGLVSLHQACRALRADDSDLALAGACQLLLAPDESMAMAGLINKDGRCYTFDDRGTGYGRGEGVAVFVLKRLDRALADGDPVHAVIAESGSNQDGKTAGIFLPNPDAQEALVRSVYQRAGLDPRETLFVEAHGTGTVAGDNAEVASIARVFGREAGRKSEIPIGSIKANIGHLEPASGVAGLVKAIMMLKKNQIPPQLNFIRPKAGHDLEERGIKIPLELMPLTPEGHVGHRRVSVNSFGYGGTNCHIILEAYDPSLVPNGHVNGDINGDIKGGIKGGINGDINGDMNGDVNGHIDGPTTGLTKGYADSGGKSEDEDKPELLVLSANSESSLGRLVSNLRQWLVSEPGRSTAITDLAYTLNSHRSKLPWRRSMVANSAQSLERAMDELSPRPTKSGKEAGVAFIFTGQGAQWHAMGRELLTGSSVFSSAIARCNEAMRNHGCDWDLVEELSRDKLSSRLGEARFAQPSTTAIQIALVDLLEALGIRPAAVCGHSSGEVAAAYAAGALSLEAAMRVAYQRGVCSSAARDLNSRTGAMLAVGEGEAAVEQRIRHLDPTNGTVTVACVNSPDSTTISGDLEAITELQSVLEAASIFNRRLKVDSAYHSHHMEVVAKSYLASIESMEHGLPRSDVAFYSSVSAERKQEGFGPAYWVSNLVSQVRFSAASQLVAEHMSTTNSATSSATTILVEVGPHSALSGPLRQSLADSKHTDSGTPFKYTYLSCLTRNEDAAHTVLSMTGKAFEAGVQLQLDAILGMDGKTRHPRIVDNLPPYPWDHSAKYWRESRLSRGQRLRPFPNHDLLGALDVSSSAPKEPRWTHRVNLQSLPWLRDHAVDGFVIFPGAGYLAMATEGMKQLHELRKTPGRIKSVNFRDISLPNPVVIHEDDQKGNTEVELQLTISPSRQHAKSRWEYFRVLSYDAQNGDWVENCSGSVSCETETTEARPSAANKEVLRGAVDDGLGHLTRSAALKMLEDVRAAAHERLDTAEIYRELAASGNEYGASFQGMIDFRVGKCCGLVRTVVGDTASIMPGKYQLPHLVHPSTFDAMLQPAIVLFRRECTSVPVMPVMFDEVCMSAGLDSTPGAEFLVALHLDPESQREAKVTFCAYQEQADGSLRPVLTGRNICIRAIGDDDSGGRSVLTHKMNFRVDWSYDVDHLSQQTFMEHLRRRDLFDDEVKVERELYLYNQIASIYIRRTVRRLREANNPAACSPHLVKLMDWMHRWDSSEAAPFLDGLTPEDEARVIEEASSAGIVGQILARQGPQYLDILTGKLDALELLVQDDILGRLYSEHSLFRFHYAQLAEYMEALVQKSPKLRFLEIGAGTGGATLPIMERIARAGDDGRLRLDTYAYTDISSGFFERARAKFGRWAAQIDFGTLDVSRDPTAQGYAAHSFDVVVAANVLHATPRMDDTLANVRRLLRPGGRLVLLELTQTSASHTGIVGTLEGWWMSQDGRRDGPLLTVAGWDGLLRRHGFAGAELVLPAYTGPSQQISSLMVSRFEGPLEGPLDAAGTRDPDDVAESKASVLLGHADKFQTALGNSIESSLAARGFPCNRKTWDEACDEASVVNGESLWIVIDSAEHPLLLNPADGVFERIKRLLLRGRKVLWVSSQHSPLSAETAALKNMVNGMARVVRREDPSLKFVTVDVQDQLNDDSTSQELERVSQILADLAMASFFPASASASEARLEEEREYAICNGQVLIPRVVPDDRFARFIDSRSPASGVDGEESLIECKYLDSSRPLKFGVQVPGLLNTIRFVDNEELAAPLGDDQIEVQVRAHGVNFKDVFIALGQMIPKAVMAGEAAGVVTAVGARAASSWKVGDRVIGLLVSPFGNQVRVESNGAIRIPDSLDFATAASLLWIYYTAWYTLRHVARVEKGQTVLIHAASGGVGQAAIQIAQLVGADIFVTVSSIAKRQLLQEQYGIPESRIFSYRHFKRNIMEATRGEGVDVVLNSLSGEFLVDSWDCVAKLGTFCEIGKTDIYGRSQLNMANFEKGATFSAMDGGHMYERRPEFVVRALQEILDLVQKGSLKPVYPVTTYPMTNIQEVFSLIAARKHVGKLVLVADEETVVPATRPKPPPLQLLRDGTYVIGGGLGDIGIKASRFLATKGAGHIVALTRREVDPEQRASLEEAIRELGSTLHIIKCDITVKEAVLAAARQIERLPPVRGIIQSALVLRDHPLESMDAKEWKIATRPKVDGTMNMQQAFCSPETTDFFIMLSSIASIIGWSSQSNYAAGNAFQDAFARAQKTNDAGGMTQYTTISVGAVEGSAQIARAREIQGLNKDSIVNLTTVSFDDVLAAIEYAMGPQARADRASECLMYFDRDIIEDAMGPEALNDRLLSQVTSRRALGAGAGNSNAGDSSKKPSVSQAVEQAASIVEAEMMVRQALLDKFAAFLGDDIPEDQSIASLGVDSLVSIELKNWVKHTFQTPLQTSELSGAASIIALAKLILSRMDVKCKANDNADPATTEYATAEVDRNHGSARDSKLGGPEETSSSKSTAAATTLPPHGCECCRWSEKLPIQPLPDLDDALDLWLETNEHFYSGEQLAQIHRDIRGMKTPDSTARQVLQKLYKAHGDDGTNGWFNEVLSQARFLNYRGPLAPFASIMSTHSDTEIGHSQAERAAIIASSVVAYQRAVKAGTVKPLEIAGKPECTWGWGWLFNSARVPGVGCDRMVRSEKENGRDHVAVLRRGRLFRVMLQDTEGRDVSREALEATFEGIMAHVEHGDGGSVWSGILTTDERDSWALKREELMAASPANAEYMRILDSAMFVLCLDDGCPETPEERARQGYLGDGANRWFDKVLQFIVSANGRSGMIMEHGMIDGTTSARLSQWVMEAVRTWPKSASAPSGRTSNRLAESGVSGVIQLDEISLQTTPAIEEHMLVLRKRFLGYTAPEAAAYDQVHLGEFGTDRLLRSRVSAKGVVDVTFQLAVRLFYGRCMPSWEPVSAAHYHLGRSDGVQRATPAVVAFCDAAATGAAGGEKEEEQEDENQGQQPGRRRTRLADLLAAATAEMQVGMRNTLRGRSYLRVFEVLSFLWPGPDSAGAVAKPQFLSDHVFFGRPFPPVFAQSNAVEGEIPADDFVHLMPHGDGLWAIMLPEKEE
ncbi:putative polyketide synthase [Xylariaceae sp. FL0804]|nr:putative polyketide synthase [Xylariaceae sp. FL0804]